MKGFNRREFGGDHYKSYFYLLRLLGENCERRLIPKNVATIQIEKIATYDLDSKQIKLISNKSFRYYHI